MVRTRRSLGDCPPPLLRLGLSSFLGDLCAPSEPEIRRRGFFEADRELDPDEELLGLLLRLSHILTLRPSTPVSYTHLTLPTILRV